MRLPTDTSLFSFCSSVTCLVSCAQRHFHVGRTRKTYLRHPSPVGLPAGVSDAETTERYVPRGIWLTVSTAYSCATAPESHRVHHFGTHHTSYSASPIMSSPCQRNPAIIAPLIPRFPAFGLFISIYPLAVQADKWYERFTGGFLLFFRVGGFKRCGKRVILSLRGKH